MMKMNPSWFLFFLMTLMSSVMLMSSNNWYMSWMAFELSLLGFLPMFSSSSSSVESMIKYFLVQASASSLFIYSYLIDYPCMSSNLVIYAMAMKLGVFPFYQWMPMVMSGISWMSCLVLVTVQKLNPIFVLISLDLNLQVVVMLILSTFTVGTGAVLAYNQSLMRPLMAYSSISHTGWIMSMIAFSVKITLLYVLIYFIMTIALFILLQKMNVSKVISSNSYDKDMNKINFMLIVMAGIPPMPIFFLKLMVLNMLVNYTLVVFSMVVFACLSVYFYLTFAIPSMTVNVNSLNKGQGGKSSILIVILSAFWIFMMMA